MPELPEVQTIVDQIRPDILGETLVDVQVLWERSLSEVSPDQLRACVQNQPIREVKRRGKYICMQVGQWWMWIHLRMTGRLYPAEPGRTLDPWTRVVFCLASGRRLVFSDARKFGRIYLGKDLTTLERKLGPEPLSLAPGDFVCLMRKSGQRIKAFLLDQKKIAGIGNIYADEALFQARIHPATPARCLSLQKAKRLGLAIQQVLLRGLSHEGATIGWYRKPDGNAGNEQAHFQAYGRKGQSCLRCGTSIQVVPIAQRTSHFCPRCQRKPKEEK